MSCKIHAECLHKRLFLFFCSFVRLPAEVFAFASIVRVLDRKKACIVAHCCLLGIGFLFLPSNFVSQAQAQQAATAPSKGNERPLPRTQAVPWMHFKNINKLPYYSNKKALANIKNAWQKKKLTLAKKLLIKYINAFGIENFSKDTHLIWQLAKLIELLDGLEAAKPLYKLVLRHHHEGIDLREIEPYYEKLNVEAVKSYVPLDYYYELVEHQRYIDTLYAPRSQSLNMGNLINSEKADYAPSLAHNGEQLYFTSKRESVARKQNLMPNEDVYLVNKEDGFWQESHPLQALNSKEHNEGSVCLNAEGNKLYFARCNAPDGRGDCDIYVAFLDERNEWSNITNLGPAINSSAWDSHPMISPSGDTLYFASDRIGGFGLSDIYYSTMDDRGAWRRAKNLGPVINSRNNELSPFLSERNGKVLYFSSNGQLYNFGGFDIYKSYWNGIHWENPINIGPLVNGTGSELYFTISENFSHIYFAKSVTKDLHGQDLYAFPLPMGAHPEARTLLRGRVIEEDTGKPIKGIVSVIDLDKGVEIAPKYLSEDGRFSFRLIDNRNYLLVIQGDEFLRIEELFYLSGDTEIERNITPISRKIEFKSIEFETGKADLTDQMAQDLRKLVDFLGEQDNYVVEISGHTDGVGQADRNLALSKARAQAIRNYIVTQGGIESERVSSEGYGSTRPIVVEKNESDRAINRRVEFHIYDPAVSAPLEETEEDIFFEDEPADPDWEEGEG